MTLGELNAIMQRAKALEYQFFLSYFPPANSGNCCRITLTRSWPTTSTEVKVVGQGATPSEAFENALANFPTLQALDAATNAEDMRILFSGMEDVNAKSEGQA